MRRALRVLLLALQPLGTAKATLEWGQLIATVLVVLGTPVGIEVAASQVPGLGSGVGFFVTLAVALLILMFWAAYRLQGDLEEIKSLAPLVPVDVTPNEQPWGKSLTLAVRNPNARPVSGCYAEVLKFDRGAPGMPEPGFRFPRSSWTAAGTNLLSFSAPYGDTIIQIAGWDPRRPHVFFVPHFAPDDPQRPIRPTFEQTAGSYSVDIVIGSETEIIERSSVRVRISFDGRGGLDGAIE